MNEQTRLSLVLGVSAALLIIGFVFSARLEIGISHAARVEATQQSPVPVPPSLAPAKAAPAHA
jgi:hypothetical protein